MPNLLIVHAQIAAFYTRTLLSFAFDSSDTSIRLPYFFVA